MESGGGGVGKGGLYEWERGAGVRVRAGVRVGDGMGVYGCVYQGVGGHVVGVGWGWGGGVRVQ